MQKELSLREKIIKGIVWLGIAFFAILIAISFGVGDMLFSPRGNPNMVATVNGEMISRIDVARYSRAIFGSQSGLDDQMQMRVVSQMIMEKLQLQLARKWGITVSDKAVGAAVAAFIGGPTGQFDEAVFKNYLDSMGMTRIEFFGKKRDELVLREQYRLFESAVGVSSDDIALQKTMADSVFQIRYAVVSYNDLRKKNAAELEVTEADIDSYLAENPDAVKDPATDRDRARNTLTAKKFDDMRSALVTKINEAVDNGSEFDKVSQLMAGEAGTSADFKIGETVKDQAKGTPLGAIGDSDIFRDHCLSLAGGKSSRAVDSVDGIYVFTLARKTMPDVAALSDEDKTAIRSELTRQQEQAISMGTLVPYYEKSVIKRASLTPEQ